MAEKGRVLSIDAARGFDMFWIIGGGELLTRLAAVIRPEAGAFFETQLKHVPWAGFHFIYMATHLFNFGWFSDRFVQGLKRHTETFYPLISAAAKFAAGYALLVWLYRRKIFFKI